MIRSLIPLALAAALAGKDPAGKAPKVAPPPAAGVKTPGVLIPFDRLKAEATLDLSSAPTGWYFTADTAAIAESAGPVRRFATKTNKPFDPSRDVTDVRNACGGLVSGFSALWTVSCDGTARLAKIDQPTPRTPGRRGPRAEGAKPEAPKAEAAKAEAPKDEKPKDDKPKADLPKPELFEPKPSVLTALDAAPTAPLALAVSDDSVWLLADSRTSLARIDPLTSAIVADVRLPSACTSILYAESALWVACPGETKLLRLDPKTNLIDKRIEVPAEPLALAAGEGSVWVLCRKEGKIARIDPKTAKSTATIETGVPHADGALAFGEGSLWASVPGFPLMRIAPATDKVVQQFYGTGGGRIAFGAGSVWVASSDAKAVTRFDPKRVHATLAE